MPNGTYVVEIGSLTDVQVPLSGYTLLVGTPSHQRWKRMFSEKGRDR
jgi:hypothetical protein